jgi:hypothetical protein
MLQQSYLRDGVAMALGGTYKVDLPKAGKLSALLMYFSSDQIAPYGSAAGAWRLIDKLSNVKVIGDGSEIIADLSPLHIQALSFYDHGMGVLDVLRNYAANTQFCGMLLTFGRKMGDRVLGLDLGRYSSVELQITNTALATEFTTAITAYISMIQFHPDLNPPSFAGLLRKELWRQWTTVQDETQYLELPTASKIRRIVARCLPHRTTGLSDTTFWNLMDRIQLNVKTGALKVVDMGLDDIVRLNAIKYGLVNYPITGGYFTADAAHDLGVGYPLTKLATPTSYSGGATTVIHTYTAGDTTDTSRLEATDGAGPTSLLVQGMGIHDTAVIWEADDDDPAYFLDPRELATVGLDVHTRNAASAAGGTNDIVLERLVA